MRVGFYGGVANNLYVFAKLAARAGWDVCFIRDRSDRFPFSQPSWEDVSATMRSEEIRATASWSWTRWTEWEQQHGWAPPDWLVDPLEATGAAARIRGRPPMLDRLLLKAAARRIPWWGPALEAMDTCDALVVCGGDGVLLALASGKPFMILPHGGEMRWAAGVEIPRVRHPVRWLAHRAYGRLLAQGFRSAWCVGSHDPTHGTGGMEGRGRDRAPRLGVREYVYAPFPLESAPPSAKAERRSRLGDLLGDLGLPVPQAEYVALIPSRIDFHWKGQEAFFRAMQRLPQPDALHVVATGWGGDLEKARSLLSPDQMTLLPFALSKALLYRFYRAVDLVVDQFRLAVYGTSASEAMSHGTPVMMWIDTALFEEQGWEPPPVFNARTEDEIFAVLDRLVGGRIDLEARSREAHEWGQRTHAAPASLRRCRRYLEQAVNG
jgi:glycosyltransferase involved in cell wall biosynthesis